MNCLQYCAMTLIAVVILFSSFGCAMVNRLTPGDSGLPSPIGNSTVSGEELTTGQTVQACIKTAEQLASDGHVREAALLYEKACRLDPHAVDYSRRLAPLYDMSGDLPKAAAEFNAALVATPADPDLLNDAGCFHDRQGNPTEAERLLRQAIAVNPEHARAKINLGIALAHQGRLQEAFDAFVPVVGPAAAHSNIGMLLAKHGRNGEALRAFEQALALDPDLPQARAAVEHLATNRLRP
jgi:Tfp pilus assembly protein PilF